MMNEIITFWAKWMLATSWQLVVMVIVVGALCFFWRKAPVRMLHLLWLLVFLKLLVTPQLGHDYSLANLLVRSEIFPSQQVAVSSEQEQWQVPAAYVPRTAIEGPIAIADRSVTNDNEVGSSLSSTSNQEPLVVTSITPPFTYQHILFVLWLVGAAGLLLRSLMSASRFRGWLSAYGQPPPSWFKEKLAEWSEKFGLRKSPGCFIVPGSHSPCLFGWFKPQLLLPDDLLKCLTPEQLQMAVYHELTHIRGRDTIMNGLQSLLQIIYWFHPLVWLAGRQVRHYREMVVDEAVVSAHKNLPKHTYEQTILALAEQSPARPVPAMVGILESRSFVFRRVMRLVASSSTRIGWKCTLLSWVMLALFTFFLIPMGMSQSKIDSPDTLKEKEKPYPSETSSSLNNMIHDSSNQDDPEKIAYLEKASEQETKSLSPEESLKKAQVGGKYRMLLRQIKVPLDREKYSDFHVWGFWNRKEWAGYTNLPPGYWVYVYPNWYIWGVETSLLKAKRKWGPEQATGEPDTPRAGDIETAWASLTPDGQMEWLMLEYAGPVIPTGVKIYETYNPGAVNKVSVFTQDGEEMEVWTGKDPTAPGSGKGVSEIPFSVSFKTNRVKIYLYSPTVKGWNEIDAVGLVDIYDKTQWAIAAAASSTYAEKQRGTAEQAAPMTVSQTVGEPIPDNTVKLSYVDDTTEGKRSLGASGHAVQFKRPEGLRFIEAVQIAASRYGYPEPPKEDFHLYLLNDKFQVLADLRYPYAMVERTSDLRWYTFRTPSVEVPDKFYVALNFNPHQTKGIYLGFDRNVEESRSYSGLPDSGYEKVGETYDWMVRVYMSSEPSGEKGIQRLADWKPPTVVDPFKECIEVKFDTGTSDDMQSYGGRGPAIRFRIGDALPEEASYPDVGLKGIRLYGSRYGSGYDPQQTLVKVYIIDESEKVCLEETFPYALFSYKAKWVDLVFTKPFPLKNLPDAKGFITIALDPEAHQYRGIYFHYNRNPKTSHSLAGNVKSGFEQIADREWMIRAYFEAMGKGQANVGITVPSDKLAGGDTSKKAEVNYLGQPNFPSVVALDPPNGSTDVDPAREHITVTFDRAMRDGYSWVDKGKRPKLEKIEWINDSQCRAWVTLEPDREYGVWLNFGPRTCNFKSREGVSADRVYWSFRTRNTGQADEPAKAKKAFLLSETTEMKEIAINLQEEIDKAKSGGVVIVPPGKHVGPLEITKPLTLRGEDARTCTIELLGNEPTITIRGSKDIVLENLTVRWAPKSTDVRIESPAAIYVRDSDVVIRGCSLEPIERPKTTPYAIMAAGRTNVTFTEGRSTGFAYTLIFLEGANGTVSNSILTDAGHSVVTLHANSHVKIIGNILGRCEYHAVRNTGGIMDMMDNLVIADNRAGAYLGNKSAHGRIANNLFSQNRGALWAYAESDVVIENNIFLAENGPGVGFQDTCNLTIRRNSFINNAQGLTKYSKEGRPPGIGARTNGNHYWNNKEDFVDFEKETSALYGDPKFTDPSNGDFSPKKGSPLLDDEGNPLAGLTDPKPIRALWATWTTLNQ